MSEQRVEQYYENNTSRFLKLGKTASTGHIHRCLWGDGVKNLEEAAHYSVELIARQFEGSNNAAPKQVLDLGCGVGSSLFYLAGRWKEALFTGVTLSSQQVEVGNRFATGEGLANRVSLVKGSFTRLPGNENLPGWPGLPGSSENENLPGWPGLPGSSENENLPGWPGLPGSSGNENLPGWPGLPGSSENEKVPGWPGLPGKEKIPGWPGLPGSSENEKISGWPGLPGSSENEKIPGWPGLPGSSERNEMDGKFDMLFSIEAFIHGSDASKFFSEAARVAVEGARLFIVDDIPNSDPESWKGSDSRWKEIYEKGWLANTLIPVLKLKQIAFEAGWELSSSRDLSHLVDMNRPRDKAIGLMVNFLEPLMRKDSYLNSLRGGHALQVLTNRKLLGYKLLTFEKI